MIQEMTAKVYYSPTARRRYLTKAAAIRREAIARIRQKHPTERAEHDNNGYCTYGGWHWTAIPRHKVLLRRYIRIIKRATESEHRRNWLSPAV